MECLIRNINEILIGFPVFKANIPCPVNGKKIINGAKVVKAPKINPV